MKEFLALHFFSFNLTPARCAPFLKFQEKSFQNVLGLLEEWANDILYEDNIRITSMKDDFNDGVIFKKIIEKLQGSEIKLPLAEDVQAKERQMKNLSAILDVISNFSGNSASKDDTKLQTLVLCLHLHFFF